MARKYQIDVTEAVAKPRRKFTSSQILSICDQVEAAREDGRSVEATCRTLGIRDTLYYRWRAKMNHRMQDPSLRRLHVTPTPPTATTTPTSENLMLKQLVGALTLECAQLRAEA